MIGGGIGGLATAIALQQMGIDAVVYERVNLFQEVGAGLTLWVNAVKAVNTLGLGDDLRAMSLAELKGGIRDAHGRILSAVSGAELEKRYGAFNLVVHRAELLKLLQSKVNETALHPGSQCTGFTQHERGVTAQFVDGSSVQGDVLIGADGSHSVVRAELWGESRPRYAGYTAWRAVAHFDHSQISDWSGELWGHGLRIGIVPLNHGRVYWFTVRTAPEGEADHAAGRGAELLDLFRSWPLPVRKLIEATPEDAILRNDIYDRVPLAQWGKGRVTLLGDAAHPTTPNLGQGACMALEDAVVLARCIKPGSYG